MRRLTVGRPCVVLTQGMQALRQDRLEPRLYKKCGVRTMKRDLMLSCAAMRRRCGLAPAVIAALSAIVSLAGYCAPASAETRGYVISWFATATNNPDWAVNCPEAAKDPKNRDFTEHMEPDGFGDKALVNGKPAPPLDYPDALTIDPDVEAVVGKYAYGFDLGGREADKFIDPETHQKVDDQLWRAVGCTQNFRMTPPAMPYLEGQAWTAGYADNAPAWTMQISGADLNKDGPVTVTLDRALSHLERDALGGFRSDVTYVIDPSLRSHNVLTGEIKNGVLWVKSGSLWMEGTLPWYLQVDLQDTHMRMRSEPGGDLQGYWGGYTDWHIWAYMYTSRCIVADCVGTYRSLEKLADYDPDPVTGKNRKISVTWRMEAMPAFLATVDGKIVAPALSAALGGKLQPSWLPTGPTVASDGDARTGTKGGATR